MKKKSIINFVSSLLCQFVIFAFGIIIPKITVSSLGSEANGFLSTINEIFIYIALVEAGLGTALLNALYKPIHDGNYEDISSLMTAAKRKFRIISILYLVISLIVGSIYPLFVKSNNLGYIEMFLSIASYGLGGAATLFLSSCITQYLVASGKNYIKQWIHLCIYILTSMSKILVIVLTGEIVFVNLVYAFICILEGLIYVFYFKIKCKNISLNASITENIDLSEQKYFLIHQISGAIFGATDLFIISIFCSLNDASIYAVYALIFTAIITIMNSIFESLKFLLGNAYAQDLETYKKVHDAFEAFYLALTFSLMLVAFILANGFVGIYMSGSDINYVDKWLPFLFVLAKLLSSCRVVCNNTHNIAHHAKQNIPYTIIESIINLTVSLVLVNFIGMYGVLIGTIVALFFRTNQTIIYTNRIILNRTSLFTYKYIFIYSLLFALYGFVFIVLIKPQVYDYLSFIIWGIVITLISLLSYLFLCFLFNKVIKKRVIDFLKKHIIRAE